MVASSILALKFHEKMRTLIKILLLTFVCSCTVSQKQRIAFVYIHGFKKMNKVVMKIPKPAYIERVEAGGGEGSRVHYYYSDSSVIYVTDAKGIPTPNYSSLRTIKGIRLDILWADTFNLSGSDENGKLWTEIKLGELRYGYSHVSPANESIFLKAIYSLQVKN